MKHLIIVQYIEKCIKTGDTWTRYKCIPHTLENFVRVKDYVAELGDVASDMNWTNAEKEFFVRYVNIKGDENYVKDFLSGLISKCCVKDKVTVKIYTKGELLPYEEQLKTEGDIQDVELANIHFGDHLKEEFSIGSYI